jgi:predicted PurR-regulated permease PerM
LIITMLIESGHRPAVQGTPPDPPQRLRSAGAAAWSLVGTAVLVLMAALLLMVLRSIVLSLVTAVFLAIVFSPLVDTLARRGLPRPAGAAVATLIVVAVAAGATAVVVAGVVSQGEEIGRNLDSAVAELQNILSSAG